MSIGDIENGIENDNKQKIVVGEEMFHKKNDVQKVLVVMPGWSSVAH